LFGVTESRSARVIYLCSEHVSGHLSVANTAALKLAGVSPQTRDPNGGVIERDASGEPTGILKETAMVLVQRLLPPDPPDIDARAAKLVFGEGLGFGPDYNP
jgi:predicted amidohydrolase YtcJ